MNNENFLEAIGESFLMFLNTSARSNKKLEILHGAIAQDLFNRLSEEYSVHSLGMGEGKESKMDGRYMQKTVDITILKNDVDIAGIAVKFVMNNYSQNSNNYFENMLGETANIRANNKKYFQIVILPEKMPYYDKDGHIKKWEKITTNNIDKYVKLSKDNEDLFFHTPVKTLIFVVSMASLDETKIKNKDEYKKYYLKRGNSTMSLSNSVSGLFGERVILNNYTDFIEKVVFSIKSI